MSLFCDAKFKFLQNHPFIAEIEENCFVGYVAGVSKQTLESEPEVECITPS